MTLAPIIPGYDSPAEPEYTYTCPHCGMVGQLHYVQRGQHVTGIKLDGSITSYRPYLDLQGIPHLTCAGCRHPVNENTGLHAAIMAHMRET